jgi:uncharacterized membrane protein YhhN
MQVIFLIIFAIAAIIYLVSLFFKNGIFQSIGKACLVPLVLAIYLSGVKSLYIPVVFALVFGWLGDIFLLKINNVRFFRMGLASFLLGHICYIPSMLHFSGGLHLFFLILGLVLAIPMGGLLYVLVRPGRDMKLFVIIYEAVILLMSVSALQLFIAQGTPFGALAFAGSLCFLASDSMLAFFTFRTNPRHGDFFVMITYIAAQFCITLGLSGF